MGSSEKKQRDDKYIIKTGIAAEFYPYIQTKWKTKELTTFLYDFEDDLQKVVEKADEINQKGIILLHIVGRSLITSREIIAICEAGYFEGAFSLARQLYEQMIHVLFFQLHENDESFQFFLDDYLNNINYQFYKYERACTRVNSLSSDELDQKYETIKRNCHNPLPERDKYNDYWWAGISSFGKLVEDVRSKTDDPIQLEYLDKMKLFYNASCMYLHANAVGNTIRLGRKEKYDIIDTSPGIDGQGQPLYFATMCLSKIILRTCQMFQMNTDYYLRKTYEFIFYFKDRLVDEYSTQIIKE